MPSPQQQLRRAGGAGRSAALLGRANSQGPAKRCAPHGEAALHNDLFLALPSSPLSA